MGPMDLLRESQIDLSSSVRELSAFEPLDLLSAVAALQLMPQNADRGIRLEALAHVAAAVCPSNGQRPISKSRLLKTANSPPFADGPLASAEDPFDNLFADAISFYGGTYLVMPGLWEEEVFILRCLIAALFRLSPPISDPVFVHRARELTMAVLALSNAMLARAGISRGARAISAPGGQVGIPSAALLERLKGAVRISIADLDTILCSQEVSTSVAALEPLIVESGRVSVAAYHMHTGSLVSRPLVRRGDTIIVAAPGNLLPALRTCLIQLALRHDRVKEVANRYTSAVWHAVLDAMAMVGNRQIPLPLTSSPSIPCFREGLFILDADKVVYVSLATDPLENAAQRPVYDTWESEALGEQLKVRLQTVEAEVYGLSHPPNEILFVTTIQGMGGPYGLVFPGSNVPVSSTFQAMSAADLQTISCLEHGDRLTLWKYARACQRAAKTAEFVFFNELTRFEFYRSRRHGFYAADDVRPHLISLGCGGAGKLRCEVASLFDPHAVVSPSSTGFVEVVALHNAAIMPVYVATRSIGRQIEFVVEALPVPIWILGPEDETRWGQLDLYMDFAETIGYWLGQLAPSLHPILMPVRGHHACIVIRLNLEPPEAWRHTPVQPPSEISPIEAATNPAAAEITLKLRASITGMLNGPTNSGERTLLQQLLLALRPILPPQAQSSLSPGAIEDILNKHAPEGNKKKLIITDGGAGRELDPRDLPPPRNLQEADANELLDELGEHFCRELAMATGPLPDGQRVAVLNKAVDFLYGRLEQLVQSLSPDGLLEWLVAHHEALIRQVAFHGLTMPTRLACFDSSLDMIRRLGKESSDLAEASIASRFVLEYVAACPPHGIRPMSLAVHDRLHSLASLLFDYGIESEFIQHGLADLKVSILPSGRLSDTNNATVRCTAVASCVTDGTLSGFPPRSSLSRAASRFSIVGANPLGFSASFTVLNTMDPRSPCT